MRYEAPNTGKAISLLVGGMALGLILPVIILSILMIVNGANYESYIQFAMLLGEALIPVPIIIWAIGNKLNLSDVFRFKGVKFHYLLYALIAGIGLIFVLDELERIINLFVTPPHYMENLEELLRISGWKSAVILISGVSIIGPLTEEMVFRGFFQQSLEQHLRSITNAVIYTALAFMISHFNIYWALNIFIIGFFLSFVAFKSNSIWPGFWLHLLNNSLSLAYVHYEKQFDHVVSFHGHTHPVIFLIGLFLLVYFGVKLTKLETC